MGDSINVIRTVGVFHGDDFLVVVEVVKERGEDPPASIKLVVTDEVGVVTLQRIQDQRLVCFGDLQIGESPSVREIELSDDSLHAETRQLRVHLNIDTLVGLHADDQLISWDVLEDARGHVLELNANLCLLLVESLSCLQDEWNTIPPFILDIGYHRGKCRASRILGDSVVFLVRGLCAIQRLAVLADNDVLGFNGRHAAKDANLLVTDIFGREGDRSLHGEERQHLQQVWLSSQPVITHGYERTDGSA